MKDIVKIDDKRTQRGEIPFSLLPPLRDFRGNYGVPRREGDKVIKGFFNADKKTLKKLDKLHSAYCSALSTQMNLTKTTAITKGNLYHIEQPYLEGVTFEQFALTEREKEVYDTFQNLLYMGLGYG
jgi:hypothetical protein